jgi:hypothetical protein
MRRATSPPYRSTECQIAEPLVSARGSARIAIVSRGENDKNKIQGE